MALYGGVNITGQPDLHNIRKLDLLPMPMISEMMRTGIAIDKQAFAELTSQFQSEASELRKEICEYIPPDKLEEFMDKSNLLDDDDREWTPMNVDSTSQLANLLFKVLNIGEGLQLKLTNSGSQISTGKKQLEQLKRRHPVVQKVLTYKEVSKLVNTYTEKLPEIAKFHPRKNCWCGINHFDDTWRIHTQILSTRTSTGRLASKDPNLQNIPARTKRGQMVRECFIASPGMEIVGADFGQFEMRLGAHYSLDPNLIRIFTLGLDPHTDTAMRAFGKSKEEVEKGVGKTLYRAPCKNVNFGIFYGLTDMGLYDQMLLTYATAGVELPPEIDRAWCGKFISDWFGLYEGVEKYLEDQSYRAMRYGIVWTLLGRIRPVPEVQSVHQRVVSAGLRQAGNMPVQGTQADLNKIALAEVYDEVVLDIRRQGIECWPVITVHDEILVEIEQGYGWMLAAMMEDRMSKVMVDRDTGENMCAVPIVADSKVMDRWKKE